MKQNKKQRRWQFGFPSRVLPLIRRDIRGTGEGTVELIRNALDDSDSITIRYHERHPSKSRDWTSVCCDEARCRYHSMVLYYGAEIQKMLHSKDRV